tara:strand:- start:439 stop:870 length:432 start_codon:yes stop_codon:yes gene_type:complete
MAITKVVFDWAKDCDWSPELEFRIDGVYRENGDYTRKTTRKSKYTPSSNQDKFQAKWNRRRGAIADVYINRDSLEPGMSLRPLVIEIDSSNKKWSLRKLEKCSEKGWDCLWIRWGPNAPIPTPEDVMCIYIPFIEERVRKGPN